MEIDGPVEHEGPAQSPWDVRGQRVLITGSSSGLGLAMARALVSAGAQVALTGRSQTHLEDAAGSLAADRNHLLALQLDVRDEASIAAARARVEDAWHGLDVLVNNAGIGMRTVNPDFMTDPKPFWDVSVDAFEAVVDTNLTGYFRIARAFVPFFLEQEHGKIVNITMNHSTMRRRGFIPYGPSRAGAESLSLIMAEDLRDKNVTVNMLLPGGATATGMIPEGVPERVRVSLLSPDIMAAPILFLCSHGSDGITGERIVATELQHWLRDHATAPGPSVPGA